MVERITSRSERIRAQRNSKGNRKSARKPRRMKNVSHTLPPVLVRGDFASMAQPKKNKKVKTPKRRFDIALSSPGVEIRLPAVPSVNLGWRLLSAVLIVGLLAVLYHIWTSPLYQVQFAEIEGAHYLNDEALNQALNLYNKPIFMLDPDDLEVKLQQSFPGLMVNASVKVILPATVRVNIQEREPIIAWRQGDETIWVGTDGVSFQPAGENDSLIRVSADASPQAPAVIDADQEELDESVDPLEETLTPVVFMTKEMVDAIMIINENAPKKASLYYDAQHGLGWEDEKHDWDVYFGMDVSAIEEKLKVYEAIKAQLSEDGISPVLISVEHIHAPYYRLER